MPKQKESTTTLNSTHSVLKITPSTASNRYDANNKKLLSNEMLGDVIVSADLNGSLKIFLNSTKLKAGGSSFFLD